MNPYARLLGIILAIVCGRWLHENPAQAAEPPENLEWPLYQGGPGFAGVSQDSTVKPPFKLVWSYRMDGDASGDAGAGVTVAGGRVYVNVLNTRSLLALDAKTGRFQWEYSDSYLGYRTTPSYSNGRLFLWERGELRKPRVLAVDASTGKPLWSYPLRPDHLTKVRQGLSVSGGTVFCAEGGESPRVIALDETTGRPVWQVELGREAGNEITQPSVAGGRVYVATRKAPARRGESQGRAGAVIALNAATGHEQWRRPFDHPSGRPLYTDGKVIGMSFANPSRKYQFRLLKADNGETVWTYPVNYSIYTPPAATIGRDVVLVKPYGGSFDIVDRKTGKRLARYKDRTNSGCGTTILAGGHAYVGTGIFAGDLEALKSFQLVEAPRESGDYGSLHAVNLQTGQSQWYSGTGNTVCGDPAIAYGRLYFTSRDGRVYCYAPVKPGEHRKPAVADRSPPVDPNRVKHLVAAKSEDASPTDNAWPMFGGTPARSGLNRPAIKLPLKTAWKVQLGDRISCGAVIASGKVFIGSDAGKLVALKTNDGETLWEFDMASPIRCTPAVAGNLVYCGSQSGSFYALDHGTGEQQWKFLCGGPIQASPAVVGDVVVFAAQDHHVYALNRTTGEKLWTFRMRDFLVQAPPVIQGEQIFVGQWNDWVYALDLYTGKMQWKTFLPISIESLAFYRDKLYARLPNYLVEMDPQSGKRLRVASVPYGYGGVAFWDDQVFLSGVKSQYGGPGREIIHLAQTGTPPRRAIPTLENVRILKTSPMKGASGLAAMTAPLVLGNTLCFAARDGNLQIVKPDGERLWTTQLGGTCHSPPIAAGGLLVVGCDDGFVYAFRESP